MTTILNPSFENATGGNPDDWSGNFVGGTGTFVQDNTYVTDGSYCAKLGFDTSETATQSKALQNVTIDSDFDIVFDIQFSSNNSNQNCKFVIDDVVYKTITADGGTHASESVTVTGLSGSKIIEFRYSRSDSANGFVYIDNIRIQNEVYNKYVDIATGSDSDDGNTWASAYLTVKKGIDNLSTNNNLHIAEGDYSAQAAINLDQNITLICEDYGGGNASPPLTVVLPVTT